MGAGDSSDGRRADESGGGPRRLRQLAWHVAIGTVIAVGAIIVDLWDDGHLFTAVMLILGWGGILALHVAYVMGLFDRSEGRSRKRDAGPGGNR